ncbi:A/G-specific adenine glycosylase [Methylomarinovum caldicuralii]|uniref:Adenine DNA glycosylase n=1 Tax=Methylomarinovum caldicuralii TaxID=438856 RepID=A0AAU9C1T2_9GAMM|nr:A/G-specific adenine glycosylase [Methylomarinovum caldicuralii]BCX81069.1 A/G-specific adenine glycosylase [Methylomarinovum caldicuralii]
MTPAEFATRLLDWFDRHGRKDLPWQHPRTPYRVWISEIMLQQTQVATVIPYFERFTARFAHPQDLADAPLDEVLGLWSGLGYYARARNLHLAARQIVERHGGELPADPQTLAALPGIGRSTAGAILSLGFEQPAPILDGNVRRLWCRLYHIDTWPGDSATQRRLWQLSEIHLPGQRAADYTQALMDFGATVCTRTRPRCNECPFEPSCQARKAGIEARLPVPRPKRQLPQRTAYWLVLRDARRRIYLERRPPAGVWGGLWAFPEWPDSDALTHHCHRLGIAPESLTPLPSRRHTFTQFRLHYHPVIANAISVTQCHDHPGNWLYPQEALDLALPAPVRNLITELDTAAC